MFGKADDRHECFFRGLVEDYGSEMDYLLHLLIDSAVGGCRWS